ncbi:hypothetical protein [Mucilaginibacter agri]|uniref:Uncharacterized protein n=1 Tax=Mucilaginibacter agri TaxID=2695265 RepID=A0A965ZJF4_9SPHI|nr:hypothetical protein [Mucilaginibacter agri]NCD70786.1 hypothetical protein [Mucilaginibacter agri]
MSLTSFLSKIWSGIKSIFDKLPYELQSAAHIAVVITQNIKNFTDSPAADILTLLIPGDIDNKIKDWLRAKLPEVLTALRLVDSISALKDPDEITAAAVKTIQNLDPNVQNAFMHDLSVLIAQEISKAQNNTLKWSDAIYIIEWYYQHKYKQQADISAG